MSEPPVRTAAQGGALDPGPGLIAGDHGFHDVRVAAVVAETDDACSIVLDIPDELRSSFAYRAGQFCTFRTTVDGASLLRSYSMSSAPSVDPDFRVTVKRVPGGAVSNWMNDSVAAGDVLELTRPAGVFQLTAGDGPIVAIAGGSGITPVISLVKETLATTTRSIRLLYANRDASSTIFFDDLAELADQHPQRLEVVHHFDVESGFVDPESVGQFLEGSAAHIGNTDAYVCGPTPFMDIAEAALLAAGLAESRLHIERFGTPEPEPEYDAPGSGETGARETGARETGAGETDTTVTIEVDGRTGSTTHHPGTTLLQAARQAGLSPPSSCESGSCATCMARVVTGAVKMHTNNALTEEEIDEGWILTCQSVPTETPIHVIYGYD